MANIHYNNIHRLHYIVRHKFNLILGYFLYLGLSLLREAYIDLSNKYRAKFRKAHYGLFQNANK